MKSKIDKNMFSNYLQINKILSNIFHYVHQASCSFTFARLARGILRKGWTLVLVVLLKAKSLLVLISNKYHHYECISRYLGVIEIN